MKKIFFSALAALSLVACVQEAVVDTPQGDAIAFENAFVDNATRATYLTAGNLEAFKVYGIVNNTSGVVFDGTLVKKIDGAWKYDGVKYWIPGQKYYFAALAPVTADWDLKTEVATTAGPGVLTFNNNGEEDLIYAEAYQESKQSGNDAVAFTFKHLLSKVKFSFTTEMGMAAQNITAEVTDIKMTAPKTASINLAAATPATPVWDDHAEKVILDFGAATDKTELFAIPTAAYDYLITFTVTIKQDGTEILTVNKASTVNGLALEMGKAYNFTATINPETLNFEDIVFNVSGVENWDPKTPAVDFTPATPVATADDFAQALSEGAENVVLTGDITIDNLKAATKAASHAGLTIGHSIVIDGNGHTLTYNGTNYAIDIPEPAENLDVTIKNVNLVLSNKGCQRGINYNVKNGILTLDNVKFSENSTANYALNFRASSDNVIVNIRDSYFRGHIALNVWGEKSTFNVMNTIFESYDDSEAEGYCAIALNNDGSNAAEGTVINIEGGKIIALDEKGDPSYSIRNSTKTGEVIYTEATVLVGNEVNTVANVTYNNSTDFYSCFTLQDAIEKASETNAAKVTLIRDIEVTEPVKVAEGKSVILDLNGKTIDAGLQKEGRHHYAIDNYGTLVIEGAGAINARGIENFGTMTINGDITITNVDTNGGAAIWNDGAITINAGRFTTTDAAGAGSYGGALHTCENGTATVNGGIFEAYSQLTYAIINEGTTTINDAVVKGKHGAVAGEAGETSIYNGTFEQLGVAGQSDHCIYRNAKGNAIVNVYGGDYKIEDGADAGGKVFYDVNLPAGYEAVEGENGWWTVKPDYVNTAAELTAALAAEKAEIFLEGGAEIEGTFNINRTVEIVTDENMPATIKGRVNVKGNNIESITFTNVHFSANDASKVLWTTGGSDMKSKPSIIMAEANDAEITFNNCAFEISTSAHAYTNSTTTYTTFDKCTFNGAFNYAMYVRANIEVTNCTYNTTVTNVLAGACVNSLASGKVVFMNNNLPTGANIGLAGAIVFCSTNNENGKWSGPVEFTVKNNTGFAYSYEKMGPFPVDYRDHTFTEGSATFAF